MQRSTSLNADWRFAKADPTAPAQDLPEPHSPHLDDSAWEHVSLPHTFNDVDTFDNFMEHGHNGERSMFTGRTWYRTRFRTPAPPPQTSPPPRPPTPRTTPATSSSSRASARRPTSM